ncbi:MAG: DUF3108 domain-containing protein [Acidobacteria bacterium]|nr:DUF3108 domain-containing protein [Acidobacteriota bacterium]
MKKLIYLLLIICSICSVSTFAQSPAKIEPFKLGETLVYEGKYNKAILRGIAIADFNFTVQSASNSPDFLLKSEAKSKGTLIKLLGFKFNQNFQSTVDSEKLRILKTVKRDEQDERVRASEAVFDYRSKKVIFVETDPNDMARPPYRTASPIETDTQDIVSAIYTLRRLPLAVGKSFELAVSDSGLVYKIPVRVTARELQKSVLGKVWCFRVEPQVFGDKRLIEQKGNMIIWITDDARRIPIRAQIDANIGRVEIKLKEIKFVGQTHASKS